MESIISALRDFVGEPDFWKQLPSGSSSGYTSYQWDYGAILEYFFACLLLCIVVSSIFGLIRSWLRK